MEVICKACGKKVDRKIAFKIRASGKNIYYCSESEYKAVIKAKQNIEDIYSVICNIFGNQVLHSALKKEWKLWREITTDTVILAYLKEKENELQNVMQSKYFSGEYASIRYFSAILKNNLKDFATGFKNKQEQETENDRVNNIELYESRKGKTPTRKGFAEIEEEAC